MVTGSQRTGRLSAGVCQEQPPGGQQLRGGGRVAEDCDAGVERRAPGRTGQVAAPRRRRRAAVMHIRTGFCLRDNGKLERILTILTDL